MMDQLAKLPPPFLDLAIIASLILFPAGMARAEEGSRTHQGHGHGNEGKKEIAEKNVVANEIENYVKQDTKRKGGYFLLYDETEKKPLVLTKKGVHKDMVMNADEGLYFACADFVDPNGKVYDIDILVKHSGDEGLEVSEVSIHKEGNEERYKRHKTEHGMETHPVDPGGAKANGSEERSSRTQRGSGSRSYWKTQHDRPWRILRT